MEIQQLRHFLAVCETRNFTRAAQRCNIGQPALTRSIQKLESKLGGLLFLHDRRQTHLTELGRLMRPHLEEACSQTEQAKADAHDFLSPKSGVLRLGVMCTFGPRHFVGFLKQFRMRHGIGMALTETVPSRLSELLVEDAVDIALMAQPGPFDERLHVLPVYRERFVLAFGPGHRFEARNALGVTDVAGEDYLSRINCEYRDHLGELCAGRGVSINRVYRSEREDWIQAMVAAGMGVCFMPQYLILHPGVRSRPVMDPEVVRDVSLVWLAGRRFAPAVGAFVKAVRAYPWMVALPPLSGP